MRSSMPSVEAAIRRVDGLAGKPEKATPASHPRVADEPAASAADPQTKGWDFYHASEETAAPERASAAQAVRPSPSQLQRPR